MDKLPTFKIPTITVDSSSCPFIVGRVIREGKLVSEGTVYHPHAGETVELLPAENLQSALMWARLTLGGQGQRPEDALAQIRELDQALDRMCELLADVVVAWTWTDLAGAPLPQPYKRPDVLRRLSLEELMWLRSAISGETEGERKNGSAPSPATSPARARRPRKS